MSVDVRWGVENQVIQCTMWGDVTIEELREAIQQGAAMFEASPYEAIHDVIIAHSLRSYPSLPQLLELRGFFRHPKFGWAVLISDDKIVNFFTTVIAAVNNRFRSFTALEQGLTFLEDRDVRLPRPLQICSVLEIIQGE